MPTTKTFIRARVGPDCENRVADVRTVQELLTAAGAVVPGGATGRWSSASEEALRSFKRQHATADQTEAPYLEPNDPLLLKMAEVARILIPLSGFSGVAGMLHLNDWLSRNRIGYNPGAQRGLGNRALWGVAGNRRWVVQTTAGRFQRGPVELDCTIYVNLMLSVYLRGDAHNTVYDADCSRFGNTSASHLARDRYGFPQMFMAEGGARMNCFTTTEQIVNATRRAPRSLYAIEVGGLPQGGVSHLALLCNSNVFECTTGRRPACIARPLSEFMRGKEGRPVYLFGPR